MKKRILPMVIALFSSKPDCFGSTSTEEITEQLADNEIDELTRHIHIKTGKKLTGPLIAVLDVAVQFRPEILDSMQRATGCADATFKMLGGEEVNENMSPDEICQYFEKTQIKDTFDGEFKGMASPLAIYLYNKVYSKKNREPNIMQYIRGSLVDPKLIQNSVLIKFFRLQKNQQSASGASSKKDFQDSFIMFLKQEIQTTAQLKVFVIEVKQFFSNSLTLEEKQLYLSGILKFVAQFFDEMKKNSHKVVAVIRESLFDDPKSEAQDNNAYMLKYFKLVATGASDQTLLAYLDQEITTADQLTAVCGEIKTFFADVYASMSPLAIDAFHKYHARKLKEAALARLKAELSHNGKDEKSVVPKSNQPKKNPTR